MAAPSLDMAKSIPMKKQPVLAVFLMMGLAACVSTQTYKKEQDRATALDADRKSLGDKSKTLAQQVSDLQNQVNILTQAKASLDQNLKATQSERDKLNASLQSSKSELAQRVAALSSQNDALNKQLRDTEQAKEAEIAKLKTTHDQLISSLQGEIANGEIAVTQLKDKLTVQLVDKILFDSGRADIKESGQQVLARIGEILKKVQDKDIRIEGHTDNVPIGGALAQRYPSNWELSTARATVVVRFLQDKAGIDPKRLIAAGYGQERPVAANDTDAHRAQNRRIEIALVAEEKVSAPMSVPTAVSISTPGHP
jgi:chemotaxis protein MotB